MKGIIGSRARALAVSGIVAAGLAAAPATAGAVTNKTFSFIGKPGSRTATVVNADSLLINARCSTGGSPVVFGFSSAPAAGDIFARVFDGIGRTHFLKNTSFNRRSRGIQLSPASADFDATATVLFEASNGDVVTVQMAMDNSTTLGGQRLCTVFGSMVAS